MKVIKDKVVLLLLEMSKYELNRFKKFLKSPYFNDNDEIYNFFLSLEYFIRKDIKEVERVVIWKKTFGNKKFIEQKYRRLASDLTKLTYRFISVEWHERDALSGQVGVLKKVNTLSLDKHYKTALRNFKKDLETHSYKDADFFYYKYISEYESHVHLERSKAKRTTLINLIDADFSLDVYYIINKLKHYCDALNYKRFLSIEINVKLLPQLFEFIEQNGYLEIPAIEIYYYISKTLTDFGNTDNYFKLVELLEVNYHLFNEQELRTLYIYATNYCITQINTQNTAFYKILYELYFVSLKRKTLFDNQDELDETYYKNIISLGIHFKDYEGLEKFILEYSHKLPENVRDNALSYNLAHVYYAKEEYDKVIEQLRYVEYNNVFYAIGGKFILLKTYYEIKAYKVFEAHLNSFSIYLRRNKLLSGDVKQKYLNSLKLLHKIYYTPNYDKSKLIKLKEKITYTTHIAYRNWLLEIIEPLL